MNEPILVDPSDYGNMIELKYIKTTSRLDPA